MSSLFGTEDVSSGIPILSLLGLYMEEYVYIYEKYDIWKLNTILKGDFEKKLYFGYGRVTQRTKTPSDIKSY